MQDHECLDSCGVQGTASAVSNTSQADLDPALADLFDELTRRIQADEPIDPEAVAAEHPAWAESIRRLLPALVSVAKAGKVVADAFLPGEPDREGRRLFGDFRIEREIGRGGMGVVYEARQLPIGRRVALKVLPPAVALDSRALQRFQLEAQVAGLLQHPGIVSVYAVGTLGGVPYYAMQYIEGRSLADLLADLRDLSVSPDRPRGGDDASPGALAAELLSGRFAPTRAEPGGDARRHLAAPADGVPDAVGNPTVRGRSYLRTVARLGVQAAEALGHAHDQGVIHRDVKPANLLLNTKGELWVADFGMADVQGAPGLTLTGDLPGTLRYMSPEQAMGKRALVDRRTDIYALGATLYELLTLEPAVRGADKQEILRRIVEEEPEPVRRLNPSVPVDLATIVTKALSKEPSARYETAWQLADDLARFLDGRPIAARPVGPLARGWRWCRRKPTMAGLAAALTAAVVLGFAGIAMNWREAERQKVLLVVAERKALDQAAGAEAAEKRARIQAEKADAMNRFLTEKLILQAAPDRSPNARSLTLLEALDRAAGEVGASFKDHPETEAAVRLALGQAYHELGDYLKSEAHLRAAHAILVRDVPETAPDRLRATVELGHILSHLERFDEAESLLTRGEDRSRRVLGPGHETSLIARRYLAELHHQKGRLDLAESLYRGVVDDARRFQGPMHKINIEALNSLG
ncbi:MAG: serine/threonine-protein kinase, partial [Isosphaeraceae bacterium]|nr:serine/threonine-protein kinase [Isosphaeraceae bacterium]